MKTLPTYDGLDELVDVDPIRLRDVAWGLVEDIRAQQVRIEDLQHELRLARQHLDDCPRWDTIQQEAAAKRRADL